MNPVNIEWPNLSPEEKKVQLFLNQKQTLDLFLKEVPFRRHSMIRASEISGRRWE